MNRNDKIEYPPTHLECPPSKPKQESRDSCGQLANTSKGAKRRPKVCEKQQKFEAASVIKTDENTKIPSKIIKIAPKIDPETTPGPLKGNMEQKGPKKPMFWAPDFELFWSYFWLCF